jgi:hypothetical protein
MIDDGVSLGEVARSLQRIERQLDTVTGDHEARLRKVERWVYAVPPTLFLAAASMIGAVVR